MKYILVTGGVISGIGKGVVASSLGVILKHCGVPVTSIKIDPYINIGKFIGRITLEIKLKTPKYTSLMVIIV